MYTLRKFNISNYDNHLFKSNKDIKNILNEMKEWYENYEDKNDDD